MRYGAYDVFVDDMDEMRVARVRFVRRGQPAESEQNQAAALPGAHTGDEQIAPAES